MITIEKFSFNPFSENTYIIHNEEKEAFIIDPGNFHPQETEILKKYIDENNLNIKNILLTHAHIDHVLGLQWAYNTYEVPVILHEIEQEILDLNPTSAKKYGFNFIPFEGEIKHIKEGETLSLGNHEFSIYHVPGHSPGHIVYYHEGEKFVISGDVLFQGSIGRTDLYKGNHEQLIRNIKEKLFTLPNETAVHCGHGPSTSIGFEKEHNPFF